MSSTIHQPHLHFLKGLFTIHSLKRLQEKKERKSHSWKAQNGRVRFGTTILKSKWVHHSGLQLSVLQYWRFVWMLGVGFGGREAVFCVGVRFSFSFFFWPAQPPQPLHILLLDYNPTRPLLKMFWHGVLRPGLLIVLKCANLNKPRLFLGPGFVRFRTGMRGGEFLSPVFILLW